MIATTTGTTRAIARALVASASRSVRTQFLREYKSFPVRVQEAFGGADALAKLESGDCQVLFLDQHLPDLNPEELRQIIRVRFPETEVVMLGSSAETDQACLSHPDWERWLGRRPEAPLSEALGESTKPDISGEPTANSCEPDDVSVPTRAVDLESPRADAVVCRNAPLPGMVGDSAAMQRVYRLTRLVARHSVSVLIAGDTGTGKELVARAVHQLSPRAGGPFVVLNCAAIPEPLLESELFGYARGAFTGAQQSHPGRIQAAQGGTLFLDEVGEMALGLQAKLLRFLDRREIQRLGSTDTLRVDVRLVAATNRHLETMVTAGEFRADLYYRLAAFPLELPPLAERRDDIIPLSRFFLRSLAQLSTGGQFALSREAEQSLLEHQWGGNVRELQQVLERAVILAEGEFKIGVEHLHFGSFAKRKTQFGAATSR